MNNKELKQILFCGIMLTVILSITCLFFSKICFLLCLILGISLTALFFFVTKKRLKSINKLNDYLSLVCAGNYDMEISDNTEGEISILKNNLFKVVVLLKTQNEELKKDKEYLADSLADITHQLKTPLTSMTVMSDLLKNENEKEKQEEFLGVIDTQLSKMNSLVKSLLKLSKIDAGTIEMNRESVCVSKIIEKSLNPFAMSLAQKNIVINQKINDANVLCDEFWTVEAFQNIIKNDIEHITDGGTIVISNETTPLFEKIEIIDNGCGISNEDLPHIFERFYSCNNSSGDSVGIGLALSKTIFEKQKATIEVESEVGVGTKFIIKFYKTIV